ncbi:hypothetical protein CC78DRAFT_606152 [Lojkania enalia]|uniref:Uncharacterized protein n=1 Tax=Lojkania enalia TaxID=147567 RepID=A0A9P4KAH2_9PLEO|nr:hypothetical protein CC78DRAFT_606152 [Didymosphaeria enalia]
MNNKSYQKGIGGDEKNLRIQLQPCSGTAPPARKICISDTVGTLSFVGRFDSEHELDSDEYDFVEKEVQDKAGIVAPVPSVNFSSTWEGAYNDSVQAYKEIYDASKKYYKAVAQSHLTKAASSIGGALAASVNRGVLAVASRAVDASSTDRSKLPMVVTNWLKGKAKMDEAKKRAKEAEEARVARKYKTKLLESEEVIEVPSRTSLRAPTSINSPTLTLDYRRKYSSTTQTGRKLSDFALAEGDEEYPLPKTPAYATGMFSNLGTPGTVHQQLEQPLLGGIQGEGDDDGSGVVAIEDFDTPKFVQRQLHDAMEDKLGVVTTSRRPPTPEEKSPYSDNIDEEDVEEGEKSVA